VRVALAAIVIALMTAGTARAQTVRPEAGRYSCSVTVSDPTLGVRFVPLVLGDLVLTRSGRYWFTRSRGPRGRWRYSGGRVRFTGPLARSRPRYEVGRGRLTFFFRLRGLDTECGRQARRPLPRPRMLNGGYRGTLVGSPQFNTIAAFDLRTGRVRGTVQGAGGTRAANGELIFINGALGPGVEIAGPDGQTRARFPGSDEFSVAANVPGRPDSRPVLSPDGSRFAVDGYVNGTPALIVATREPRVLATLQDLPFASADGANWSFAPDGRLYFAGAGIEVLDPVTGTRATVIAEPSSLPVVSPDGRRLAYVRGSTVWVAAIDGSQARELVTVSGTVQSLAWAPDGRALAGVVQADSLAPHVVWILPLGRDARRPFSVMDSGGDELRVAPTTLSWGP
jgi:hypothetical protein